MTPRRHHRLRPHARRRVGAPRRHRRVPRARARGRRRSRSRSPATTASACTCTSTSGRRRSSRSASRGRPDARRSLLCTSGTAAANFHPAVLEAHHGRVPMIVCTADRPPELRDTGAGQTVDQVKLYGDAVRWFHEPDVPDDRPGVGADVARAGVARGRRGRSGRRPARCTSTCRSASRWCPPATTLVDAPGRSDDRPWTARAPGVRAPSVEMLDALAHLVADRPRGLVVAGWGAGVAAVDRAALRRGRRLAGARRPDLEPAGARHRHHLRPAAARPRVRRRPPPRRRVAHRRAAHQQAGAAVARPDGRPGARRSRRRVARPAARGERPHGRRPRAAPRRARRRGRRDRRRRLGGATWRDADACRARRDRRRCSTAGTSRSKGASRATSCAAAPDGASLVVASSMPVRDVESFAAARDGVHVLRQPRGQRHRRLRVDRARHRRRGRRRRPTVALVGDLCFLHDSNGLLGARRPRRRRHVRRGRQRRRRHLLVPPAGRPPRALRDAVRHAPAASTSPRSPRCTASRHRGRRRRRARARARSTRSTAGGVQVVRVRTDRADNVTRHREVWAAVADSLRAEFRSIASHCAVNAHRAQGRTSARSMGSSFAWVSAHSASGSEPGDDAGAGDQAGPGAVELGAAQRDGPLAVAAGVDPADRAGVAAAVEALERADGVERGGARACRRPRAWGAAAGRARAHSAPARRAGRGSAWRGARPGRTPRPRAPRRRASVAAHAASSASTIAVDDEAVLAGVLHRRRQREQRFVAVGDGGAGDRAATRRRRRCGARAARGSRRRSRRWRTRTAGLLRDAGRGRCRGRRTARRPRSAPRARARPSRARRASIAASARSTATATRRATAAPPPGTGSAARPRPAAAGAPGRSR